VQGNLLKSYGGGNFVLVVIGLFTIILIVSYPLSNFPARLSMDYILYSKQYHERKVKKNAQLKRLWLYSIIGYGICASIGAFVTNLDALFTITGATANALLALILPCLIFLKLRKDGHVVHDKAPSTNTFLTVASVAVIIFGVTIGIGGLTIEILDLVGVQF